MASGMGRKLGGGRIVLNSVAVINSPRTEPGALKASNQPPFGLAGPPLITSSPSHSVICSRSHCLYNKTLSRTLGAAGLQAELEVDL